MVGNFLRGTFGPDAFLDTKDGLVVALAGQPVVVKVSDAAIVPVVGRGSNDRDT